MLKKVELLKCPVCDTVVEVLAECGLEMVCCGPAMIPLAKRTAENADDSHALLLTWSKDGLHVKIGPDGHCMEEDHFISWVEVRTPSTCYRQFLQPGQPPCVSFAIDAGDAVVRAYCNVHGLWQAEAQQPRSSAPVARLAGRHRRLPSAV